MSLQSLTDTSNLRTLRVAMVLQSYRPVLGGAQRQVEQLAPLLAKHGIECRVITRQAPGALSREIAHGATIERVAVPDSKVGASAAYTLGATARVLRYRPDVVHVFDLHSPSLVGLLGGVGRNVPVVAKVLSTGPGGDLDRLAHKAFGKQRVKLLASRFAAFHTLSEEVETELLAAGVEPQRLVRIPNGVDTEIFHPPDPAQRAGARAAFGLPPTGVVSLFCGRFAPVKRLEVLLEAFSQAPGHLLMLGEGPMLTQLREQAQEPSLRGRVTFHAAVDDPAQAYRSADAYVSTSLTEGMSGSMLEAMASGLAILAAPASGVHDLFTEGGGVIATENFAQELRDLLADAAQREQIGARAREVATRRFALTETAAKLAGLYRQLAR